MHAIGTASGDVRPGRYAAPTGTGSKCSWQRLSSQTGPNNVLAEGTVEGAGQAVIDIIQGDKFFNSTGCGTWTGYVAPTQPDTTLETGQWVVGPAGKGQAAPGTYRTIGAADCKWQRLTGFSGEPDEVLASGDATSPSTVQLAPTDVGFSSSGCPTWTKT
jgi:hypothetical protein